MLPRVPNQCCQKRRVHDLWSMGLLLTALGSAGFVTVISTLTAIATIADSTYQARFDGTPRFLRISHWRNCKATLHSVLWSVDVIRPTFWQYGRIQAWLGVQAHCTLLVLRGIAE